MILLDTHIWVWWVNGDPRLSAPVRTLIQTYETIGLAISVISCWEVAKLVEGNRLVLTTGVSDWIEQALAYPGVRLLDLTPEIAVASTQLPPPFHRDPADQIIVATARTYSIPIVTSDARIIQYQHVVKVP